MRINYLANAIGLILRYVSIAAFVPIIFALYYRDFRSILPFIVAGVIPLLLGYILRKISKSSVDKLNDIKKSEALMVVSLSWISFGIIGAIPYLFYGISPLDSLFEGVSGITTTGATILSHLDYPKALIFWRSFSQWLGGMGVIVLFVAILPQFAVAGRQMFYAEAPGPTEDKITPRIKNTASALWIVYAGLTAVCFLLLHIFGMPGFDSICNALSTLSAGGFCPHPKSIEGYNSQIINWIIICFMFLSGCSFVLQSRVLTKRKPSLFFKSEEFMCYAGLVLFFSVGLTLLLYFNQKYSIFESLTAAFYQVLSFATSTGSTSKDYLSWNFIPKLFLFITMFLSSCSGSAGGGVKISRWILICKYVKNELYKILHPNAVISIKNDNTTVSPDVIKQTIFFVFCFFAILMASAVVITSIEKDIVVGITSATSSIGCIGPAFGAKIGPMGNYSGLQPLSKMLYILNMFVGRLEIIPFLVMFHYEFWKFKQQ